MPVFTLYPSAYRAGLRQFCSVQIIDPATYVVREVAGKVVTANVRTFDKLCEDMQRYYTQYTPSHLHGIEFRPGTVSNAHNALHCYIT